jgi:large subunit ribosomal protein L4e
MQTKSIRSGKGKRRGRKYKSNQGMLIVKSRTEKVKTSGVDIKNFDELKITDLFPLGRITLYTKKSLEEMKDA